MKAPPGELFCFHADDRTSEPKTFVQTPWAVMFVGVALRRSLGAFILPCLGPGPVEEDHVDSEDLAHEPVLTSDPFRRNRGRDSREVGFQ